MHKMKHKEHMSEMKCLLMDTLKEGAETLNDVRCEIEESIINHDLMPGKSITETPDSLIIKVVIPGVEKKSIDLNLSESSLMLEITLDMENYIKGGFVSLNDKRTAVIKRKISLPKKVNPAEAKANLENGILKVEVSKLEKDKMVNIKIE